MSPSEASKPSGAYRLSFCVEAGFLLFVASLGVLALFYFFDRGSFAALNTGARQAYQYAVLVGIPSGAALLLIMSGFLFPPVMGPGRWEFPLNLTLPVLHSLLMLVLTRLILTPPTAIEQAPEPLQIARFWSSPMTLVISACVGIVFATLASSLVARKRTG